jgi:hypothetical protein
MNPNFRKVALIAASLGLVVSLFVALRDDDAGTASATEPAATTALASRETQAPAPPTAEPLPATEPPATTAPPPATTAQPATTAAPAGPVQVRLEVEGGRPKGGIQRPSVKRGREVVLIVASDVADHVHLHGYDIFADVAPGRPARLEFTASVPGRFEIELEDRRVHLADLEVRP